MQNARSFAFVLLNFPADIYQKFNNVSKAKGKDRWR